LNNLNSPPPVIAIDGPSASGKGTVAQAVALALGWHYLDSGALYRLVALAALRSGMALNDREGLEAMAASLDAEFHGSEIFLNKQLVTEEIRSEECGNAASAVAAIPEVRAGLLQRQRAYRRPPGLVADGRDMGAVVFPDARLKVFLTATAQTRAERRHKQLIDKGIVATLQSLLRDLKERDARDRSRSAAPLQQNPDARLLDTTGMSVAEATGQVLEWYRALYCNR